MRNYFGRLCLAVMAIAAFGVAGAVEPSTAAGASPVDDRYEAEKAEAKAEYDSFVFSVRKACSTSQSVYHVPSRDDAAEIAAHAGRYNSLRSAVDADFVGAGDPMPGYPKRISLPATANFDSCALASSY